MMMTCKKYAYTLKEIGGLFAQLDYYKIDPFKEFVEVLFGDEDYFNSALPTGNKVADLWQRVINEYEDSYIAILDKQLNEYTDDELKPIFTSWFKKFFNMYINTREYYETVLKAYEDKKTHLLDQVKSTSDNTVKFNDIPQVESGDFTGDSYATTFTHSEGENNSDFATTMTRLKEIQDDFKNIWHDWLYEFRSIFYEDNWEVM